MIRLGLIVSKTLSSLLVEMLKSANGTSSVEVSVCYTDEVGKGGLFSKVGKYLRWFAFAIKNDVLCLVYIDKAQLRVARFARMMGKKVIFFWIGTDVWHLAKGDLAYKDVAHAHVADGSALVNELAECGVEASSVLFVPKIDMSLGTMPREHAIMLNIPDDRLEFYNYPLALELIKDFPDTKFVVVRSNNPSLYEAPNVDFRGSVPMEEMDAIYDDVSIIWRYPEHDSLSLVSMEALAKGKYVLSRFPFPCATTIETFDDGEAALRELLSTKPQCNLEGHEYAASYFTQEAAGTVLLKRVASLMEQ